MKIIFFGTIRISLLIFSISLSVSAQEPELSKIPDDAGKIKAWIGYCETLRLNGNSVPDNFVKLQQAGMKGLGMMKTNDYTNRSKCFFFVALGNYYQLRFDSAQYYFYRSLTDAQKGNDVTQITKACVALIPVNFQLQQPEKVEACKSILQSIADTAHSEILLQDLYYALGSYYQQKSYYSTAQDYFIKSIQLREKDLDTTKNNKKKFDYAIQCDMLSKLYLNTEMVDKSLDALHKGARFASVSPTVGNRLLSSFVEAYTSSGNIDSALYYDSKLETETKDSPMFPSEVVSSDLNIAIYYLKKKDYKNALIFLNKADTVVNRVKSPLLNFQAQMVRGRFLQETGKYDQSIPILLQAMPVAKQLSKELYANVLKYLALDEKGKNNASAALGYFESYTEVLDSLTREKISRTFADLETHYQTNEKEQRIRVLDKENKLHEFELKAASRERLGLILGLAALGVISLLLYFIYKNKEQLNGVLNEKNERLDQLNHRLTEANETKARLFGIIGHDLRSPVSKIVQLLRLQKERPDSMTAEAGTAHAERLRRASENVLETMEDMLIWSKSQMQHFSPQFGEVSIRDLMDKEIMLIRDQYEHAQIENRVPETFTKQSDENFLSIIFRNLLQNAVRYGDPAKLVRVSAKGNELIVSNYSTIHSADQLNERLKSMAVNSTNSGLGLQIAEDLATRINIRLLFQHGDSGELQARLIWEASTT